jgi:hypothetical protein
MDELAVRRGPAPWREFTEEEVKGFVGDIEKSGYAVIPGYITNEDLVSLQRFVGAAVEHVGNNYVALNGYSPVANTALGKLADSSSIKRLCMRCYELLTSEQPPHPDYHQVLRCLTGDGARKNSMIFHFDSYVLTLLLPIEMPRGKDSGELIVLPNVRPLRRWYVTNLIDKLLLDNPLTQSLLRKIWMRSSRFVKIALNPGDLYLFWGYRSVHTNAPCDVDKIRATALLHYADPHRASRLKKMIGR